MKRESGNQRSKLTEGLRRTTRSEGWTELKVAPRVWDERQSEGRT